MHPRDSPWNAPATVSGFAESPPNGTLIDLARGERARHAELARALDLGCGAGRNALPLAALGWRLVGLDSSQPMLAAAAERARRETVPPRLHLLRGGMDRLPFADAIFDFVIAHGIWNLATSTLEFRQAVREAARVSRPGALLFVFTFSRTTLLEDAKPVVDDPFVFTQFSGRPQIFLTRDELLSELDAAGFAQDPSLPVRELNRPAHGTLRTTGPVIYEGAFRRTA